MGFNTGESITFIFSEHAEKVCGTCRREIKERDIHLDIKFVFNERQGAVTLCRFCLSEYAPKALVEIEKEVWLK